MPFIGNQPALSYTSFAKQDFSTSATTSYTLDNPVTNANELALFINFVRQEPTTAYTASGTTLTLTSATSATDDMYCVFLGKAVQTVNPPSGSVGLSQLSATGTKDATTFLRGDNTFASAGGTNTPAFEAYLNTEQNLLNNAITIVSMDTEVYDEGGCFNATGSTATLNGISVPARTFLPNVAGKYFVYAAVQADDDTASNLDAMDVFFYNESDAIISQQRIRWSNNQIRQGYVSLQAVINLNGSSNSVKLKTRVATADGTGPLIEAYPNWRRATYFGAYRIIT